MKLKEGMNLWNLNRKVKGREDVDNEGNKNDVDSSSV